MEINAKTRLLCIVVAAVALGLIYVLVWHYRQARQETESPSYVIRQSPQTLSSMSPAQSFSIDDSTSIDAFTDDKPHSQPVDDQNEEQEAGEFLAWLESLEQENSLPDEMPDSPEDPAETAKQTIENFLNAGIAGDWEQFISYCRGAMKANFEQQRAYSIEIRGSIEESDRILSDRMSKFTVVGIEPINLDHAVVHLTIALRKGNGGKDPVDFKYREGEDYDEVAHFSFYVERYDDGWYLTDGSVEGER